MLVRNPRRGIIGPSERFYQVFAAPQHRHLFTGILSFLTDSSGAFTEDIVSFSTVFGILAFLDQHFQKGGYPISGRRLDTGGITGRIIRSFSRRLD